MTRKLSSHVFAALVGLGLAFAPALAVAGRGGSAGQIRSAVASGSVDAIIAEIERTEALVCPDCVDVMTNLLDHERYEVREAAGWWFAKRPSLKKAMIEQMVSDLGGNDVTSVRNAADFLGAVRAVDQLGALAAAYDRGVGADARLAMVRAAAVIASPSSATLLGKAFSDADPTVRSLAVASWRDVRGQGNPAAILPLLGDSDAGVRREAAASAGGLRAAQARVALEQLVVADADALVRRNAAWALGRIGSLASAGALEQAATDVSPLVRGVAKAARLSLR
jgi:HEAT repeats